MADVGDALKEPDDEDPYREALKEPDDEDPYREVMLQALQTGQLDGMDSWAVDEYFQLIDHEEHEEMKEWDAARHVKLLSLEKDSQKALSYALNNKKLGFITMVFQKLHADQRSDLLEETLKDEGDCNFLHLLAKDLTTFSRKHIALTTLATSQNLVEEITSIFKLIFGLAAMNTNSALPYQLLTSQSVVVHLITVNIASISQLVIDQLSRLSDEQRIDILKQMVCYCGENHPQSIAKCSRYNNLLMCALQQKNKKVVEYILEESGVEGHATEIVLGRTKAKTDEPTPSNSLLIAAECEMWEEFNELLQMLPASEQMKALFETNNDSMSAIQKLVKFPPQLYKTLALPNVSKRLKQVLIADNYCQYRFAELEMPLKSVGVLDNGQFLINRFLVPKFSEKCQPAALIFHNSGTGPAEHVLDYVEPKAKAMFKAFSHLGWIRRDLINLQVEHVDLVIELREYICKIKDFCSLFVLCIASHGRAGEVENFDEEGVKISSLLREIKELEDFIPKVLILDRCRTPKEALLCQEERLRDNNILLLEATLPGEPAYDEFSYLQLLAAEIERGNDTIQAMNDRARANAMEVVRRQPEDDELPICQIPHQESTAKEIFIRKRSLNCPECKRNVTPFDHTRHALCSKCTSCYCLHCVGLDEGDGRTLAKPGVSWSCEKCRHL